MYYLSAFSVLLPLFAGIILFRKLDLNSCVVVLLAFFASVAQIASYLLRKEDVWKYFNIYTVVDAVLWAFIFFRSSRLRVIRTIIFIVISLQVITTVLLFVKNGIQGRFYYEFVCLNSLLETLWVLSYFYEYYTGESIGPLERQPLFWFCLGILNYSPTTYFLFVFYEKIKVDQTPEYANLWSLHGFINACMYFIFLIGIVVNAKQTSKSMYVFGKHQS